MGKLVAIALLLGTIIGAGILGLPFIFWKAGFLTGLLNLFIVGTCTMLMTLYVGELSLYVRERHQLAGFAEKFYGKKGKLFMLAIETFGIYTALIAYLLGIGNALANLTGLFDAKVWASLFFIFLSYAVYKGLKVVGEAEFSLWIFKFILLAVIVSILLPKVEVANLHSFSLEKLFLPFGVVLFACLGYTIIPEVEEELKGEKRNMGKVITISYLIVFIVYAIFSLCFVGAFDGKVAEIATSSMEKLKWVGDLFVLATMCSPYLALTIAVRDVYRDDMKLHPAISWFLACFIPYFIFLTAKIDFISMLLISGTYAGAVMGIFTCFMILKARRKKKRLVWRVKFGNRPVYFCLCIFIGGIVYETLALLELL